MDDLRQFQDFHGLADNWRRSANGEGDSESLKLVGEKGRETRRLNIVGGGCQ